jgi:hypothetical protein
VEIEAPLGMIGKCAQNLRLAFAADIRFSMKVSLSSDIAYLSGDSATIFEQAPPEGVSHVSSGPTKQVIGNFNRKSREQFAMRVEAIS